MIEVLEEKLWIAKNNYLKKCSEYNVIANRLREKDYIGRKIAEAFLFNDTEEILLLRSKYEKDIIEAKSLRLALNSFNEIVIKAKQEYDAAAEEYNQELDKMRK